MNNLKEKILNLTKEISELPLSEYSLYKESINILFSLTREKESLISKTLKEKREKELKLKEITLREDTSFISPEYPSVGVPRENGSCSFTSKEQAEELLQLIYNSYYVAPKLNWQGPGDYIITPEYKYDHDGDIIYTDLYQRRVI